MKMKRDLNTIWLSLLVLASAILCGLVIVLFEMSGMILYDSNVAISKTMTETQRQHMYSGSRELVLFSVIPMAILTGMWVLAFLIERREHNETRRQFRQQLAADDGS